MTESNSDFANGQAGGDPWFAESFAEYVASARYLDRAALADDACLVREWLSAGRGQRRGAFVDALSSARQWKASRTPPSEPATLANGTKMWLNPTGAIHRDDGAAVLRANGDRAWYRAGNLHREGEPAVVRKDGSTEWWRSGSRFRVEWRQDGKLHRDDGKPAVEDSDGRREWWHRGARYIPEDSVSAPTVIECGTAGMHWVWLKTAEARRQERLLMGHDFGPATFEQWPSDRALFSLRSGRGVPYATVQMRGLECEETVGRDGGPPPKMHASLVAAAIGQLGTRLAIGLDPRKEPEDGKVVLAVGEFEAVAWVKDGALDRQDGPALVRKDGKPGIIAAVKRIAEGGFGHARGESRFYAEKGRLHRAGAPAVLLADGSKEWWVKGVRTRKGEAAVERADGRKEWWEAGKRHRDAAPAVLGRDGGKAWWRLGKRHREEGPAVERADGSVEYWYLGVQYSEDEFYAA